ncbi:MAG: dihydrofolate reductase [Chitinophagaceae bacterium]|nr:dihydrofolate reductase [Chitinophagaceae bacterium]
MIISLIVAASENNVIGKDNKLLWHLPNDLKFFKNTTWAMPIIMGRKTFESIGSKALNGRLNIVITNQKKYNAEGVVIVNSLEDAVFVAKSHSYKEVFIIGGGEIFKAALSKAEKIYLTRVHTNIEGEVVFPEINEVKWKKISSRFYPDDEKHQYSYTFELWERK